jgi:nicotinate-nucleotide adenylyltransferase
MSSLLNRASACRSKEIMRVGVFGGTFDPVHFGHLILAEQAREQARLDEVWFVPAARPPHKIEGDLTRFDQRCEMLALGTAGYPAFRVLELEKDRPGPSYTVDTLTELHCQRPEAELWLLVGSDTLVDLGSWHEKQRLPELAGLLVMARPGHIIPDAEYVRRELALPPSAPLRLAIVDVPLIDIASSDLRRRVATGRSIRYFLPRAVEMYIREKKLYREAMSQAPARHSHQ